MFHSGRVVLERCDGTKCSDTGANAEKYTKAYCTSTQPNAPIVQSYSASSRELVEIMESAIRNASQKCLAPGLDSINYLMEEHLGVKELKIVQDTPAFDLFNELKKMLNSIKDPCVSLALSKAGVGPVVFFNGKTEKFLSLAFKQEREHLYAPCFQAH